MNQQKKTSYRLAPARGVKGCIFANLCHILSYDNAYKLSTLCKGIFADGINFITMVLKPNNFPL